LSYKTKTGASVELGIKRDGST